MRFLVAFENTLDGPFDYGPLYMTEESCGFDDPKTSNNFSDAFRFHSFADANSIVKVLDRGEVIAVDEPTHFRSLNEAAEAVASLRADMLFGDDEQLAHLPRYAQHHLLLALAALETAHQHLKIGWMEQMDRR